MLKDYIKILFLLPLSLSAEFLSSSDSQWNYHFESYTNVGGVLESNKAIPIYTVDDSVLNTLMNSLPENSRADLNSPEYFPSPEPEIVLQEKAEVFVTFYHEGAGYKNALGYYTYDGDTNRTRPNTLQEVEDNGKILLANASLLHSGGDLTLGTSVSLGELSAGTKVIFFLVSNGWKGENTGVRSSNDWIFSSWSPLNKEYDASSQLPVPYHKHVALLWNDVGPGNILLMGFEDILRTYGGCDHDYNDALFAISSSPMSALTDSTAVETGISGFSVAQNEEDTDGDGVNDAFDSFPIDSERAYVSYYPNASSKATLVFEDMWPEEGDYDMNDLSIRFSIQEVKNASHQVKDINLTGEVQSYGAGYTNGFAIKLDTNLDNIESIQMDNGNQAQYNLLGNAVRDGSSTIITIFTDAQDFMEHFVNVYKGDTFIQADTFSVNIVLKAATTLSPPPYNPYLVIKKSIENDDGSDSLYDNIEVHLPNYAASSFAPLELFGTLDDSTNLGTQRSYLTGENKPWALLIPTDFAHPVEQVNIEDAYIHYLDWVNSNGASNGDWYLHNKVNDLNQEYSNKELVIIRP